MIAKCVEPAHDFASQRGILMFVMGLKIEHRVVGTQHVFSSPDLPGLFVAHRDREQAEADLPAAIEMLRQMERRLAEKRRVQDRIAIAS
jgi:hypothetical protein